MGCLTWWNFPTKAWLIIMGELFVITGLSVWLYLTYLNDIYFQVYANGLAPVIVPILSVAFGVSSASIAAYLYVGMKRARPKLGPKNQNKGKVGPERASKRVVHATGLEPKPVLPLGGNPSRLKPVAPIRGHTLAQKPQTKEREKHSQGSEIKE